MHKIVARLSRGRRESGLIPIHDLWHLYGLKASANWVLSVSRLKWVQKYSLYAGSTSVYITPTYVYLSRL